MTLAAEEQISNVVDNYLTVNTVLIDCTLNLWRSTL